MTRRVAKTDGLMAGMLDRVREAFRDGEYELSRHDIATRIWPDDEYPRAWRYAVQGGPPGWVRTWGAFVKRHRLHEHWNAERGQWCIFKPSKRVTDREG